MGSCLAHLPGREGDAICCQRRGVSMKPATAGRRVVLLWCLRDTSQSVNAVPASGGMCERPQGSQRNPHRRVRPGRSCSTGCLARDRSPAAAATGPGSRLPAGPSRKAADPVRPKIPARWLQGCSPWGVVFTPMTGAQHQHAADPSASALKYACRRLRYRSILYLPAQRGGSFCSQSRSWHCPRALRGCSLCDTWPHDHVRQTADEEFRQDVLTYI